jgi:hypothetical protein
MNRISHDINDETIEAKVRCFRALSLSERPVDSTQPALRFKGFQVVINFDHNRPKRLFTSFIGDLFFKYQEPVMDQAFQVAFLPCIPA